MYIYIYSLLNHVRYRAPACRAAMLLIGPVITYAEAEQLALEDAAQHRRLYANACRRYNKNTPCMQLAGPLPLIYYYRFGFQWHSGVTRNRAPNKNNKFSHFRNTIHNNKHGCWVYNTYFRTDGDNDDTNRPAADHEASIVSRSSILVRPRVLTRLVGEQTRPCAYELPDECSLAPYKSLSCGLVFYYFQTY